MKARNAFSIGRAGSRPASRRRRAAGHACPGKGLVAAGLAFAACAGIAQGQGGAHGGEPWTSIDGMEPARLAEILAEASRHPRTKNLYKAPPDKFTFHPMGGTLSDDLLRVNFVDLDPTEGILDWDCTDLTLEGHDASDIRLLSFGEQAIGVPVFAALDGVVNSAHDGEDDMHTECFGSPNWIHILHAGGRSTMYLHLKRNSVLVSPGQEVKAGEQIGLVGSSGCSSDPHLHFATYDSLSVVEPYAGECRPGESDWVEQVPIDRDFRVLEVGLTDSTTWEGLPVDPPRKGTFVEGFRRVVIWIWTINHPENSFRVVRFRRPDDSIARQNTEPNVDPAYHAEWKRWSHALWLNQLGTWHIEIDVDGVRVVNAPFDVVASAGQVVNRPPEPIAVALEPEHAQVEDVLVCRVDASRLIDDPDYDIVRYRYVWMAGEEVLRAVTTAARSDALPHHSVAPGSTVTCAVTPSDGIDEGPAAQDSIAVPEPGASIQRGLAALLLLGLCTMRRPPIA